jgi:hypothetical protein
MLNFMERFSESTTQGLQLLQRTEAVRIVFYSNLSSVILPSFDVVFNLSMVGALFSMRLFAFVLFPSQFLHAMLKSRLFTDNFFPQTRLVWENEEYLKKDVHEEGGEAGEPAADAGDS